MRKSRIYTIYTNDSINIADEEFTVGINAINDLYQSLLLIDTNYGNENYELMLSVEGLWDSVTKFAKKYWNKFTSAVKELWNKLFKKKEELKKAKGELDDIVEKATKTSAKADIKANKGQSVVTQTPEVSKAAEQVKQKTKEVNNILSEIEQNLLKSRGVNIEGLSKKELKKIKSELDKEIRNDIKTTLKGEHTGILQW